MSHAITTLNLELINLLIRWKENEVNQKLAGWNDGEYGKQYWIDICLEGESKIEELEAAIKLLKGEQL